MESIPACSPSPWAQSWQTTSSSPSSWAAAPSWAFPKKVDTAVGMGMAVIFVMGVASAVNWPINEFLNSHDLGFMQTVTFILVIASLVQFVEMFLAEDGPSPLRGPGRVPASDHHQLRRAGRGAPERAEFLQLRREPDLRYHRRRGLPAGHRPVCQRAGTYGVQQGPKAFDGFPIALVAASLISLAFMGFSGLKVW